MLAGTASPHPVRPNTRYSRRHTALSLPGFAGWTVFSRVRARLS
jgi:hypothetical protein